MMSAGSVTSSNSTSTGEPSAYRKNAYEILEKIDVQFMRAIKEVNEIALSHGRYSIAFIQHPVHRKGGIPEGAEFKEFTTYTLGIVEGSIDSQYDDDPLQIRKIFLFSLGKVTPFSCSGEELKIMAQTGSILQFEEIYTHWYQKLSEELTFFNQHYAQIFVTKEKINQQFIRAIKEAHSYSQQNAYCPVVINQGNFPFFQPSFEDGKFEPLERYGLWMQRDRYSAISMDWVTIIKDGEQFKKIVTQGEVQDFEEIFSRCSGEMKVMMDKANAPAQSILSSFCALL